MLCLQRLLLCVLCASLQLSYTVEGGVVRLDGNNWKVRNSTGSSYKATVPGVIQTDLFSDSVIGNPWGAENDLTNKWVAQDDWSYSTTFSAAALEIDIHSSFWLVCEGLDTAASVFLNGNHLGDANNQFRTWRFNIDKSLLRPVNSLVVTFTSAIKYAQQQNASHPNAIVKNSQYKQYDWCGENRLWIRKTAASFGWNWGPCYLPVGIWRSIWVESFNVSMYNAAATVAPNMEIDKITEDNNSWTVVNTIWVQSSSEELVVVKVLVTNTWGGPPVTKGPFSLLKGSNLFHNITVDVENVALWWPYHMGTQKQPLYEVTFTLMTQQGSTYQPIPQSAITKTVGFRSVELRQDPYNNNGTLFYFRVNGQSFFARGSNWIPQNTFLPEVSNQSYYRQLMNAKEGNIHILRVWGGGSFEKDEFYNLADQLGILLWQEMMFANGIYPVDAAYLENIKEEVTEAVYRLQHHPSIALWCGNNEIEADDLKRDKHNKNVDEYWKLYLMWNYHNNIPAMVKADPYRPFWPSSPSNGFKTLTPVPEPYSEGYISSQTQFIGDEHYYMYEPLCTNVSEMHSPRYMSEFGWPSFPSFYSMQPYGSMDDFTVYSDWTVHRQDLNCGIRGSRRQALLPQIARWFAAPQHGGWKNTTLDVYKRFIYIGQALQAVCISAQTEHLRRSRDIKEHHTMGAMFWQLNSEWPGASKSSVEHNGKWKLLHHFSRQFFSSIHVSLWTQEVGSQLMIGAHIANDIPNGVTWFGDVQLQLFRWTQTTTTPITTYSLTGLQINSNSGRQLLYEDITASFFNRQTGCTDLNDCFISATYTTSPETAVHHSSSIPDWYYNTVPSVLYPNRLYEVKLPEATFKITFEGPSGSGVQEQTVSITSDVVAPLVWFEITDNSVQGRWEVNGILLLPGDTAKIRFIGWTQFDSSAFQKAVEVYSVNNIGAHRP